MTKKSFKSILRATPLLILLCLLLTGCSCKHEWNAATCTTPKTCSLCQETEGDALGHTWVDASCEAPKTCSVCKATEGEALGHTWVEATCESPKTCSVCAKTEGEPAEHTWVDATTETPKTCSACQKTEGERIITDSRFTTSACKDLFGTWSGVVEIPGSTIVDPNFTGTLRMNVSIVFHNDGTYQQSTKMLDVEQFNQSVIDYYIFTLYAEFSKQGLNQSQADEAMMTAYGMDTKDYAKKIASGFNWNNLATTQLNGVYYVAEGKLYSGYGWGAEMESDNYTISNNSLTIESLMNDFPNLILTKS